MRLRNPVVLRLTLAVVVLITCSCAAAPVALAPGADRVNLTHNAADVAGCKAVGNVSLILGRDDLRSREALLRNRTVGLDGNTVFLTTSLEGVAYRCP
jgi:hypothetical protein